MVKDVNFLKLLKNISEQNALSPQKRIVFRNAFCPEKLCTTIILNTLIVLTEEKVLCVKLKFQDFVKKVNIDFRFFNGKEILPRSRDERNKCFDLRKEQYTVI